MARFNAGLPNEDSNQHLNDRSSSITTDYVHLISINLYVIDLLFDFSTAYFCHTVLAFVLKLLDATFYKKKKTSDCCADMRYINFGPSCRNDYLEVLTAVQTELLRLAVMFDDDDEEGFIRSLQSTNETMMRNLGRFCGSNAPPPVSSMGLIRLRFVTDRDSTDRGWVARYQLSRGLNSV